MRLDKAVEEYGERWNLVDGPEQGDQRYVQPFTLALSFMVQVAHEPEPMTTTDKSSSTASRGTCNGGRGVVNVILSLSGVAVIVAVVSVLPFLPPSLALTTAADRALTLLVVGPNST